MKKNYAPYILEAIAPKLDASKALRHPIMANQVAFAQEVLATDELPSTHLEDYKRSDVNSWFNENIAFAVAQEMPLCNADAEQFNKQAAACLPLHQVEATTAYIYNQELLIAPNSNATALPAGTFLGLLNDFLHLHPQKTEQISKIYGRYAESDIDGSVALNTLLAEQAILFYVPKDTVVEPTLHFTFVNALQKQLLITPRMLIVVEDNSKVNILFSELSQQAEGAIMDRVVEIDLGKDAQLNLFELQLPTDNTHNITTTVLRQHEQSEATFSQFTIGEGNIRNNFRSRFLGGNAKLNLNGLVIAGNNATIDNFTRVEHVVSDCQTNELFKYLVNDEATGSFTGRIFIAQHAQKTLAYQQNRNLLLSPKAKAFAKPHLEIYADDVHCSHGMTTGQLDADALFYMQQRGISEEKAKSMLSIAFTDDVLKTIEREDLQNAILNIIEEKLSK